MLVLLLLLFVANGNAQAATVRALNLPNGYTIRPEAERKAIVVARDGAVFAIASVIDERSNLHAIAVRWHNSGSAETFEPLDLFGGHDKLRGPVPHAVAASSFDSGFVTVGQVSDGATIRMYYKGEHWSAASTTMWKNPLCGESRFTGTYILDIDDDGQMAVTFDPSYESAGIDLQNPASVRNNLPIAVIAQNQKCTVLGAAIVTAVDGKFAAGYLGFLDGKAAPASINVMVQKMVAFRWLDGKQTTLGAGVPYAISRTGLTAGASALPGHAKEVVYGNMLGPAGRYEYAHPHATAWLPNGQEIRLVQNDERSVAWDVSEDGTIAGMEQRKGGKHYAFRWKNGRVQRLDDLPHPRGWRFESAYAVERDGSIVGIGTYNGVATAFIWSE